jgi:hypothetical protein
MPYYLAVPIKIDVTGPFCGLDRIKTALPSAGPELV